MYENRIGQFIAALRKEKKMTQKDLATQLHITDKAISKWERGLSCPDISLLNSIADILGVTTSELLNGQRNTNATSPEEGKSIDNALEYAEKSVKEKIISFQNLAAIIFSVMLFLGIIVCSICDIAISGKLTWSLYPISSVILAWLIFIPMIKFGNKGILGSLISLSIFIIPFLYVISAVIGNNAIMPIAVRISLLALAYLWCVYFIFKKLKGQKILATAFSLLLAIPLCLIINFWIAKLLSVEFLDIWDFLSFAIIIVGVIGLLIINYCKRHKRI